MRDYTTADRSPYFVAVAVGVRVAGLVGVRVEVTVTVAVAVAVREGVTVAVAVEVAVRVGVKVAVGVRVNVGVRVGVAVKVAVGVRVGVRVAVDVRVGEGVIVGVWVGVNVSVGVLVGVAVHTRSGQRVGVHVGVKVQVGGMVAVREDVNVIVGVTGFSTRPIRLNEPSAIATINMPKKPMMANFNQPGICERPPRRRGLTRRTTGGPAVPLATTAAGTTAAATLGVSMIDRAARSAATLADNSPRRFSPTFCSSLAALTFLGLIAKTCRRQSSFSASSTATVLSHSQAFSLRGSVTRARLNISRALSFWPRRASVMPWAMRSLASIVK